MKHVFIFLFPIFCLGLFSCERKESSAPPVLLTPEQLVEKGRSVYVANCLACHNADPGLDGAVGPANRGASKELLAEKLLNGGYPQGYSKKRETNVMPKFPQLKDQIDALHAYLNSGT